MFQRRDHVLDVAPCRRHTTIGTSHTSQSATQQTSSS
jgi:hypothetical protein